MFILDDLGSPKTLGFYKFRKKRYVEYWGMTLIPHKKQHYDSYECYLL